ncbi:ABC transporter permease [Brevibacillus fulvus]|uniref:Peptide/nickel transport system permease protein n=1 Tax=Brevibacillus fulvus TaxID=1125967 RepID=A0A939BU26_9BACL|nr:ABC transporter permease subunit [Brevibacillus fulvus]MBM7590074.1 peptide/nickel transport system permease protein [Brevibacillus fulvus]
MQKNRMNLSLWVGSLLVAFLVILAIVGPWIAPYEEDFKERVRNVEVNGKTKIISPPLPPSADHWLGTDKAGSDLLSLLLYGARYTIFVTLLIAFLRVLAGTVVGVYLGTAEQAQRWWLAVENAWGYIPMFIPAYFLLSGINVNAELPVGALLAIFIGLLSLLGIPSVVASIRQKTEQIKHSQYVLAATALGAGRHSLIYRHILPQLKEQITVMFVTEAIAIMTLMGLLGMFDMYVGGTFMTTDPITYHSVTHEWAGLVGAYRGFIYSAHMYIFLAPLGAYTVAVVSFALLGKGLRQRHQGTYHRTAYL